MTNTPGLIVVGVDGTISGDAALAFAVDEAERSGDRLEVITTWDTRTALTSLDAAYGLVMSPAEYLAQGQAERAQKEALERAMAGRRRPPVVRALVVRGDAGRVLVSAGRQGRLLVVGCRPDRRARGLLGRSVSRYCARNFSGPLTTVSPTWSRDGANPS